MKEQVAISSDGRNGNMNIKKFFDKENFVPSTFDKKQKTQSLVVSCALVVFFIIASFTFFNMLYAFSDIVGSIVSGSADVALKDFSRSVPLFLTFFMSLWTVLMLQASFRNVSEEKRLKSLLKDSICLLAFAGFNFIYVLGMTLNHTFSSMVEGSPSPFYPLDSILFSLIFVAIGVLTILYVKKWKEKAPYLVPGREIVTKARGLYCVFVTFWMLFALFAFSGSIFSLFIYDFKHEFAFYGVMVVIAYFLSPLFLGVWEFYYNELKEEKKKEFLLPLAIAGVALSVIVVALYFVSLGTGLDAPSNAGFGMFPVAFAASVNIATMLTVATPLIVSVVALIKGLLLRKQKAE